MKIPDPKANYEENVEVLNYRKNPNCWESGFISGLAYKNKWGGSFSWSYDVTLYRRSKSDRPMFLYVSGKSIRKREPTP